MKTAKTNEKSKKTSSDKKPVKNSKSKKIMANPGEEKIREKAEEIYNQRIDRGEEGTAENDWHEAVAYFMEHED
jgi:hypothetical protein